jgi:hypothetical protein
MIKLPISVETNLSNQKFSLHHSVITKINNKMKQSKKIKNIKKIKKGTNVIFFSKTSDNNLKLVKYFESGLIKNMDKNIIIPCSSDLTIIYNSFINKIIDCNKCRESF